MANFTSAAIKKAFLELLEEKPYSNISVKDIVCRCGINRNSFYYHYRDIPMLVEELLKSQCDKSMEKCQQSVSFEETLDAMACSFQQYRKQILNLYRSTDRRILEQYHWKFCDYFVSEFLKRDPQFKKLTESDKNLISRHLVSQCFGMFMLYLEQGIPDTIQSDFSRLKCIYERFFTSFFDRDQ